MSYHRVQSRLVYRFLWEFCHTAEIVMNASLNLTVRFEDGWKVMSIIGWTSYHWNMHDKLKLSHTYNLIHGHKSHLSLLQKWSYSLCPWCNLKGHVLVILVRLNSTVWNQNRNCVRIWSLVPCDPGLNSCWK